MFMKMTAERLVGYTKSSRYISVGHPMHDGAINVLTCWVRAYGANPTHASSALRHHAHQVA
jgi:hypothetical protein